MDGWNTTFLLGRPIFRGYVSFGGCINLLLFENLVLLEHDLFCRKLDDVPTFKLYSSRFHKTFPIAMWLISLEQFVKRKQKKTTWSYRVPQSKPFQDTFPGAACCLKGRIRGFIRKMMKSILSIKAKTQCTTSHSIAPSPPRSLNLHSAIKSIWGS